MEDDGWVWVVGAWALIDLGGGRGDLVDLEYDDGELLVRADNHELHVDPTSVGLLHTTLPIHAFSLHTLALILLRELLLGSLRLDLRARALVWCGCERGRGCSRGAGAAVVRA